MIINLVVLVAACSFAQNDDQLSRATLRGIKGVRVSPKELLLRVSDTLRNGNPEREIREMGDRIG